MLGLAVLALGTLLLIVGSFGLGRASAKLSSVKEVLVPFLVLVAGVYLYFEVFRALVEEFK